MFLHDYLLACEISTVRTPALIKYTNVRHHVKTLLDRFLPAVTYSRLYSQLGPEQALSQIYMYKTYNIGGQQKNKTNIETEQKQTNDQNKTKSKQKYIRIIKI